MNSIFRTEFLLGKLVAGLFLLASCAVAAAAYPLNSIRIDGHNSHMSLSTKDRHENRRFGTGEETQSVTLMVKKGEEPTVMVSFNINSDLVRQNLTSDTYIEVEGAVDGATWEGTSKYQKNKFWRLPVKHGWNTLQVRMGYPGKMPVTQKVRFFAYVFTIENLGKIDSPMQNFVPNRFVDSFCVDGRGNFYGCFRSGADEYATLRYSRAGRLTLKYPVHRGLGTDVVAADADGSLYLRIMDNLVKYDAHGKFLKSVARFGQVSNGEVSARNIVENNWTRNDKSKVPLYKTFSPYSSCETAIIGDSLYFLAWDCRSGTQRHDNRLLVGLSMDGRNARILAEFSSRAGGICSGPGGRIYLREYMSGAPDILHVLTPSGGKVKTIDLLHTTYHYLCGFDGAGYLYAQDRVSTPDFKRQSTELRAGRNRKILQKKPSPNAYIDLFTGKPSNVWGGNLHVLAHWLYDGSLYLLYDDLYLGRFTSHAPGARSGGGSDLPRGRYDGRRYDDGERVGGVEPGGLGVESGTGQDTVTPGYDTSDSDHPDGDRADTDDPLSPLQTAAGTIAAGILAAIGAMANAVANGVPLKNVIPGLKTIMGGETETPTDSPSQNTVAPPPLPVTEKPVAAQPLDDRKKRILEKEAQRKQREKRRLKAREAADRLIKEAREREKKFDWIKAKADAVGFGHWSRDEQEFIDGLPPEAKGILRGDPVTIERYKMSAADYAEYGLTGAQLACDIAVSALGDATGPEGVQLKYGYVFLKSVAGQASSDYASGKLGWKTLVDGSVHGAASMVMEAIFGKVQSKIPGGSGGTIANTITKTVGRKATNITTYTIAENALKRRTRAGLERILVKTYGRSTVINNVLKNPASLTKYLDGMMKAGKAIPAELLKYYPQNAATDKVYEVAQAAVEKGINQLGELGSKQ